MRHPDFENGAQLRAYRKAAGLTQAELAELTGFERNAVGYWERKKGRIAGVAPGRFRALFQERGIDPAAVAPHSEGPKTCGAKTRSGTACGMRPVEGKKRCRLHGGLSTGPKSVEGIVAIRIAQKIRWRKRRTATSAPY